jgi:2-polyprenyl-3-methyl-5-hydroxy-6-metoxy-1,4-benzoquinol methylase
MSRVHYTNCPVCGSPDINPLLTVEDHSVSREKFTIWQCSNCTLRFTQDVPDESSIGPYYQSPDYISHSDTSKGVVNQLYQKVRRFTMNQKASMVIHQTVKKGKVLDLGAGTGAFLHSMKNRSWHVEGIEPDAGARERARQLGLELSDTDKLEVLEPRSFDAITLWHVLEHVHSLHAYMERIKLLLRDEGSIFIAVPNYESLDSSVYKLYWAAYDAPRHLYHFTPRSMELLAKQHALKIVAKKPMWFDSFYISLLSSKYKNGRTNWPGAFWSGLRSNIKALSNRDRCSSIVYILRKDQ